MDGLRSSQVQLLGLRFWGQFVPQRRVSGRCLIRDEGMENRALDVEKSKAVTRRKADESKNRKARLTQ